MSKITTTEQTQSGSPANSFAGVKFQCRHIFTDGRRCASPTLRSPAGHEPFCYYHHTARRPAPPQSRVPRSCAASSRMSGKQSTFTLPLPEDPSSIQLALGQVLQLIASNQLDPRRAGLLLYGLQIASLNLKRNRQPETTDDAENTVTEITHDPDHGPLALPAELHENKPMGSAQRLLMELQELDELDQQRPGNHPQPASPPNLTVDLHAAAATGCALKACPERSRTDTVSAQKGKRASAPGVHCRKITTHSATPITARGLATADTLQENMLLRQILPNLVFLLLAPGLIAQTETSAPRSNGNQTPLRIYEPAHIAPGCAPLAILSHGAGGSDRGLAYLALALSADGYLAIVMGHQESGFRVLASDMRSAGYRGGLLKLVTGKDAESDRLLDVSAALQWADARCHAPFRVLLGHSMGGETTMFEAGAKNVIGVASPPAGQDRFDAYVPLSSEGPGPVFPDNAWSRIHKPMLVVTGTQDQSLSGGPEARTIPWRELPSDGPRGCHWLAVVTGATHMDIGGNGNKPVQAQVIATVESFLNGVRAGKCTAPPSTPAQTISAK